MGCVIALEASHVTIEVEEKRTSSLGRDGLEKPADLRFAGACRIITAGQELRFKSGKACWTED